MHLHVAVVDVDATHVPPFMHGFGSHGLLSAKINHLTEVKFNRLSKLVNYVPSDWEVDEIFVSQRYPV